MIKSHFPARCLRPFYILPSLFESLSWWWINGGYFFFVLGGFFMTLGYKDKVTNGDFNYKQYFTLRCIRFYPPIGYVY